MLAPTLVLSAVLTSPPDLSANLGIRAPESPVPARDVARDRAPALLAEISDHHGVDALNLTTIPPAFAPGDVILVNVDIAGESHTLLASPHSVRAENYELIVQRPDGTLVNEVPGPVRTVRGSLVGAPGSTVAGGLLEDGLHLRVTLDGEVYWIEPVDATLQNAREGDHFVYRGRDVHPSDVSCGTGGALLGEQALGAGNGWGDGFILPEGMAAGTAPPCVAEHACDADVEYFNTYGTEAAVEARINSIINTLNTQYETQVGISHLVTAIIVRTGSTTSDPYDSTDAQTRLCEFITEWTNNQGSIQRDVAQLFTGVELNSSTIGIASDIGGTGICQNSGACTGGTYGTQGSYCLSQSDFNGSFSCATDLSAHELGHLWGAFHCSCSGNTMNPSITCANSFSQGTINSIISYRNTRDCLAGDCPPPPGAPANDNCSGAVPFNDGNGDGVIAYDTTFATTDGPANPANTCNDFGQNQTWNDIWYTYQAQCSGTLTLTTCNGLHGAVAPSYDTDLVVYGPYVNAGAIDCGGSSLLASLAGCNDDDPVNPCGTGAPYSSTVEIPVSQGDTYLIRVGGWNSPAAGTGNLSVVCAGTSSDGACCFGDGSCEILSQNDCSTGGGSYLGDGTACGGDADGDGIGDACDPCPQGRDTLDVTVQLEFVTVAGPITRCVTFELHDSVSGASTTFSETLSFVGGVAGAASNPGVIPLDVACVPGVSYDCVSARDELHTLRNQTTLTLTPMLQYAAAAPLVLRGGDLNDDNFINIYDFTDLVSAGFPMIPYAPGPNTTCATPPIHRDIEGDGFVETLDLTFVTLPGQWQSQGDASCIPAPLIAGPTGGRVTEVSVEQLHAMGMGDRAVADVNDDGWVNTEDVALVMVGVGIERSVPELGGVGASRNTSNQDD